MLTKEFCEYLEWKVSEYLINTSNKEVEKEKRGYWCDGILMPSSPKDYSKKTVNDSRQIITQAWIGRGVDEEQYECIIQFGKYALRRYAKGTNLKECVPGRQVTDWVVLDSEKKLIVIRLL